MLDNGQKCSIIEQHSICRIKNYHNKSLEEHWLLLVLASSVISVNYSVLWHMKNLWWNTHLVSDNTMNCSIVNEKRCELFKLHISEDFWLIGVHWIALAEVIFVQFTFQ
jgi:hypothetical protein